MVVCAQATNNESKWKWKHPYVSITRGMKSSHGARLAKENLCLQNDVGLIFAHWGNHDSDIAYGWQCYMA
jgi:hypothetical protein